jgi:hypothetical protein
MPPKWPHHNGYTPRNQRFGDLIKLGFIVPIPFKPAPMSGPTFARKRLSKMYWMDFHVIGHECKNQDCASSHDLIGEVNPTDRKNSRRIATEQVCTSKSRT